MCCTFRLNENCNHNNHNKLIYMIPMMLLLAFSGCESSTVKNNKLYNVKEEKRQDDIAKINDDMNLNIKGNTNFYKISFAESSKRIPITESPDKKYIFYLSPCVQDDKKSSEVIMGYVSKTFNLNKYNVENGTTDVIKRDIPLISTIKWNKDGDTVAFCGGNRLTIYSLSKQRLLFEDDVKHNQVIYFGWSPEGRKLYTEHPNLVNCTIYYLDSNDKAEIYNTNETKYFKGKINDKFYYVTEVNNNMPLGKRAYTSIVDQNGNEIKKVYNAKVRDYYDNSLILVGENEFGLYYIRDINDVENILKIDDNYIYDAKFIYNGNFAYITKNNDITKNNFLLKVIDQSGKTVQQLQVSGSTFVLFPDGQKAKVSGVNEELIDFKNNSITSISSNIDLDADKQNIYTTLRGAFNLIGKYISTGEMDMNEVKKYFVNTHNPEQTAYFDIENMYKDKKDESPMIYSDKFNVQLETTYYRIYFKNNFKRAEVKVKSSIDNAVGTSIESSNQIELIYLDQEKKWYITGFSTFISSEEYEKVHSLCEKYIEEAKQGNLFEGVFKDKYIGLGQIQFWQMSSPTLSSDIKDSNHCKVYLNVKENENDDNTTIYKMILEKDNLGNWKIESLSKDNLSKLY